MKLFIQCSCNNKIRWISEKMKFQKIQNNMFISLRLDSDRNIVQSVTFDKNGFWSFYKLFVKLLFDKKTTSTARLEMVSIH